MRPVLLGLGLALIGGCTSNGFKSKDPNAYLGGQRGDLRVLLTDSCPAVRQANKSGERELNLGGFTSIGVGLLEEIAGSGLKSFGTYLKEAGKDDITRSFGSNGGSFYSAPDEQNGVTIAPQMRCVYLVRNGFGLTPEPSRTVSEDMQALWNELGLTGTPDLFAALHIEMAGEQEGVEMADVDASTGSREKEPGEDFGAFGETSRELTTEGSEFEDETGTGSGPTVGRRKKADDNSYKLVPVEPLITPPYFRVKLDRLFIGSFQSPEGTSTQRDLAIVANYGLASSVAAIRTQGRGAGVSELAGPYAVGAIRLPGVAPGEYSEKNLTALQTIWMTMPPAMPYDRRATSDVTFDVVEFSPGNQMLTDIGAFLSKDETVNSFKTALGAEIDGSADATAAEQKFTSIGEENTLIRALADQRLLVEKALDQTGEAFDREQAILEARILEDKLLAVEKRLATKKWYSTDKLAEVGLAKKVLSDPRLK